MQPKPRALVSLLLAAVAAAYPFVVYFALPSIGPGPLLLLIAGIAAARLSFSENGTRTRFLVSAVLVAAAAACAILLSDLLPALLLYPVVVNAAFLFAFAATLVRPPSLVERIARRRSEELPAEAREYCRKVTILWCGVFLFNIAAAIYTACCASLETWTLWNGFLAYLFIGAVAAGEYAVRLRFKRRISSFSTS